MTQVIPFENSKLPAFLATAKLSNTDLIAGAGGGGFPILSIKGKIFTLVKGDERKIIDRPDEPGEPASYIEVVLLKANPNLSKVYYIKGFDEDAPKGIKPDCFSNNGTSPDPEAAKPQCKTCAACPHNVFGSGPNGKGKACSDSRRVAIASPSQINEPMLLRVPPASLKPLAEYGKTLANRGVPYSAVITRLRFEREEATPKLKFEGVGYLTEAQYAEVQEMIGRDTVENILGHGAPVVESAPAAEPQVLEKAKPKVAPDALDKALAPAAAAKPKPEPEPVAEPTTVAKKPVVTVGDDLDAMLSNLDD